MKNDYKMYNVIFPYTVKFVLDDEQTFVTIKTKSCEKYFAANEDGVRKQKELQDKVSIGSWAGYLTKLLQDKIYDLDMKDCVVEYGGDWEINEMSGEEIVRFQRQVIACNED